MTDFNSYMGNIDTDFFRELCLRNGELRYYKRNEFILREEKSVLSSGLLYPV